MSVLVPKSQAFFFSSDTTSGARNVSTDGSKFTIYLDTPISLPQAAMNATVEVSQASIWNVSYNISADFANNNFNFVSGIAYDLTIPDGLYSLSGLNAYLATQFVNLGFPANLIVISGDDATQKTILTFLNAGDQVDFTQPNSVREILGFNSRIVTSASAGFNEFSDSTAAFNRVNSYLIKSTLVSQGLNINNIGAGVIASVPITVSPGSQINYQPRNPIPIDASELVGQSKNAFTFSLLDQSLRPAPTAGELYNFVVIFR